MEEGKEGRKGEERRRAVYTKIDSCTRKGGDS